MTTLYLVRHGEVYNPQGIIYGRLPGFGLSAHGRTQIEQAAALLEKEGSPDALYASPMQRAQESAAILADRLQLDVITDERIIETSIGTFQGKTFADLPKPHIAEEGAHPQLESAASMRARFLSWVAEIQQHYPEGRVAAVAHRDPRVVVLLHWMGAGLEQLPGFDLDPGSIYKVRLTNEATVQALHG